MKQSQRDRIKKDLLRGILITPMSALKDYRCFRLAARINELRDEGFQIATETRSNGESHFAEYSLIPPCAS